MEGVEVSVLDDEGNKVPDGVEGEICALGEFDTVYFKDPERTAKAMLRHPDGKTLVRTGDIGYVDEDGFVFLQGRAKRMFMDWFGFKMFPAAIENVMALSEDVEYTCVVPVQNTENIRGFVPFAFYTVKPTCKKSEQELNAEITAICQKELPEYMQPKYLKKLDEMPRTPIGKTDFVALEKKAAELAKK